MTDMIIALYHLNYRKEKAHKQTSIVRLVLLFLERRIQLLINPLIYFDAKISNRVTNKNVFQFSYDLVKAQNRTRYLDSSKSLPLI